MSDISKLVGEKIREMRKYRGLSQEKLAEKADLNVSYIGQVERGGKRPTIETLDKIVTALDFTFEELFSFENKTRQKDTTVIDKIMYELNSRPVEEQKALYNILKDILQFKDKRQFL